MVPKRRFRRFLNDNEILIADFGNNGIQHLNIKTGTVVKCFGKCGAGKGEFKNPADVCLDDKGRIVVADYNNNRIQVISKEGETIFTFGDSGPERLNHPLGCIPFKNMILISNEDSHCIKALDVIYQTRETVFHRISKHREEG